jgi:hypothetical protein
MADVDNDIESASGCESAAAAIQQEINRVKGL